MKIKNILAVSLIASLLLYTGVYAQENNVEMVSGGVGDAEMDDITVAQKNYTLKLIFANSSGEYLADVSVVIKDKKGDTIVDTSSVGPVLLLKLKAGTYNVSASTDKETKTNKITVRKTGLTTQYFHINALENIDKAPNKE